MISDNEFSQTHRKLDLLQTEFCYRSPDHVDQKGKVFKTVIVFLHTLPLPHMHAQGVKQLVYPSCLT